MTPLLHVRRIHEAAERVLNLEMTKAKYDSAKERVAKLHAEFLNLESKLGREVKNLDRARGQLVTQMQGAVDTKVVSPAVVESTDDEMTPIKKVIAGVAARIQSQVPRTSAETAQDVDEQVPSDEQVESNGASTMSDVSADASRRAASIAIVHALSSAVSAKASFDASQNAKGAASKVDL